MPVGDIELLVTGFWVYIRTLACVLHLYRVLYDAVKARITKLHCSYLLCGCAAVSSRVPGGCFVGCVLHFPPLSLPTEVALRCPVCHSSLRISQGKAVFLGLRDVVAEVEKETL